MSCRVLKRELELAMFDALIEQCQARGIQKIMGVYIPSKKNSMVAEHYAGLGFQPSRWNRGQAPSCGSTKCPRDYSARTRQIRRTMISSGPRRREASRLPERVSHVCSCLASRN